MVVRIPLLQRGEAPEHEIGQPETGIHPTEAEQPDRKTLRHRIDRGADIRPAQPELVRAAHHADVIGDLKAPGTDVARTAVGPGDVEASADVEPADVRHEGGEAARAD